jgi:hypothetical protein
VDEQPRRNGRMRGVGIFLEMGVGPMQVWEPRPDESHRMDAHGISLFTVSARRLAP